MSDQIALLIPSLRPQNWPSVEANINATAPGAKAYFLGEKFPSYATAINAGWRMTDRPYVFTSDDDTVFSPGWAKAALACMAGDVRVVGSNDLHNPFVLLGKHSTHSLVDRRYIEEVGGVIDQGPGSFLFEYDHNYTDSEFVETARHRGVFVPCLDAVAEHMHPDFGGRVPDAVHERTRRHWVEDYDLFVERRPLWGGSDLEYPDPRNLL